jgi:S-formylglutathione hydrolase FrmB
MNMNRHSRTCLTALAISLTLPVGFTAWSAVADADRASAKAGTSRAGTTAPPESPAYTPVAQRQAQLPASVSNVSLTADAKDPRIQWLAFDSGLLGLRATTRVLLPPDYTAKATPYGTLYQLHGTRGSTALGDMILDRPSVPNLGAADSGASDPAAENFLVVQPDAGQTGWCNSCWWVDGRAGQGVLAESHLLTELIPVVESTFNVRSDRGGRALYGTSMGGIGALIQAFRHPDSFIYVASQSGPPSIHEHEDALQLRQDSLYYTTYLIGQGYPDPVTNPAAYRNIDVVTLAPQVAGTGLHVLLGVNDGCLAPYDATPQPVGDPACLDSPDPQKLFQMQNEWGIRTQNEVFANRLLDVGVPFRLETDHGRHGVNTLYSNHVVRELNTLFAMPSESPTVFSYKTTDRAFSVWGYDVDIDRPNEEFAYLAGARVDGTAFTVAGTGTARIVTPPVVAPGSSVTLTVERENEPAMHVQAVSDATGRVAVDLTLGETRTGTERRMLTRQGLWPNPRTRVLLTSAGPQDRVGAA